MNGIVALTQTAKKTRDHKSSVIQDIRDAIMSGGPDDQPNILDRPMDDAFSLQDLLQEVTRHYLERALEESEGNKRKAARLVGLKSHQTFVNWCKKNGVDP